MRAAAEDTGQWQPSRNARCHGQKGTLVKWTHSKPAGRAEMCKSGTPPVQGPGYDSWECDGVSTVEHRLHCCTVLGKLHCAKSLADGTAATACACSTMGNAKSFL